MISTSCTHRNYIINTTELTECQTVSFGVNKSYAITMCQALSYSLFTATNNVRLLLESSALDMSFW